ncbi:MAG: hypothetical protein ACRD04_07550 [Terriglobales bacterium]
MLAKPYLQVAAVAGLTGVLVLAQPLAPSPTSPATLTTQQVVQNMVAMRLARRQALRAFTAVRSYQVSYSGLGHKSAAMTVRVAFRQPGPKRFIVISESGSRLLRQHVRQPLLATERRDAVASTSDGNAIVPKSYRFTLISSPQDNPMGVYVLRAVPRFRSKRFLFRGQIWLNPNDFGIERIEGKLPHAPSFWVTHPTFVYLAQKIGDFWLPATNRTHAHIRLFGEAELEIRYHDFHLTSNAPVYCRDSGVMQ